MSSFKHGQPVLEAAASPLEPERDHGDATTSTTMASGGSSHLLFHRCNWRAVASFPAPSSAL